MHKDALFLHKYRVPLLAVAMVQSLLTSGIIFGWAPMQLMLQDEGQYDELCEGRPIPCPDQQEQFNLIFIVGSSTFALSVWPTGALLDKFGPLFSCMTGGVLFTVGTVLFGLADSKTFDVFLPGYAFMALGGPSIVFSFFHLSNLFPSKRNSILTAFNVAIDASTIDFVIFGLIHSQTGIGHRNMFLVYTAVPILVVVMAPFLWPRKALLAPLTKEELSSLSQHDDATLTASESITSSSATKSQSKSGSASEDSSSESEAHTTDKAPSTPALEAPPVVEASAPSDEFYHPITTPLGIKQLGLPFGKQVFTSYFIMAALFMPLQMLRVNYYIATVHDQALFAYPQAAETWTTVFGWVLPFGGLLSIPLVGHLLDKRGMMSALVFLNVASVLFALSNILDRLNPYILIATYILSALFRDALFGVMSSYVSATLGFQNFGKLWGLLFFIGGVLNIGLYFVVGAIYRQLKGDFLIPNIVMLALALALAGFAVWFYFTSRRVRKAAATLPPAAAVAASAE